MSSGSPKRVDRCPLGEIHSLLRSPAQSDRHRSKDEIHDDENNYGNTINPAVTPKKRRLENRAPLAENNEADWSTEKKVRTPQKLRYPTIEICAGNSSPIRTPIASPATKLRPISIYRRPIDDDLPKSSTKKRKDHNLLEVTNSDERENEVLVKTESLDGNTKEIIRKDSVCDQAATVVDSRKLCPTLTAKADVVAADEARVWVGMAEGADATDPKKKEDRHQQVILDNSLSRAFENQRLESIKAVISIDEICRHLENLQSTYEDNDLRGHSVDSSIASNSIYSSSRDINSYGEIVGRIGSTRVDSSGYLQPRASTHLTESTIKHDEHQGANINAPKQPVVNVTAHVAPMKDTKISKIFSEPSLQNTPTILLTEKSSDRVDGVSISEAPSQRRFAAALHNEETVFIPGVSYEYIRKDIERMRENVEMQVISTAVHTRQELSSSLGCLDKDSSNSSRGMQTEDGRNLSFPPNFLNVIDISVATAQHRKQQEIREANQSTKHEDYMHQRYCELHTNLLPSCMSSSSGNSAINVSSFTPGPVSADTIAHEPIEAPLAQAPVTIPSRDKNAHKRPESQPAAASTTIHNPANTPPQMSTSPHSSKGTQSEKMEDSEKMGESESEEDRQYTSFHAAVAAARESSMSVLFRGKRGSLGQHLSSVQQTAAAFHMTEVDFLSCSTVLRRGEVLSPLGIQGPSPTVISAPIYTGNGNREDLDSIMRRDELAVSNIVLTTLSDTASSSQSHYLSARVPLSDLSAYQSKLQSWRGKYRVKADAQSSKDFNLYPVLSPHSEPSSSASPEACSSLQQQNSVLDKTTGISGAVELAQYCIGSLSSVRCEDIQFMHPRDDEEEGAAGFQTARDIEYRRNIRRDAVGSGKES